MWAGQAGWLSLLDLLVEEGLATALPGDHLLSLEPQGNLFLGGLQGIAAVNEVPAEVRHASQMTLHKVGVAGWAEPRSRHRGLSLDGEVPYKRSSGLNPWF